MDKKELKKVNGGYDWYQCPCCGSNFTDGDAYDAHYERFHADNYKPVESYHKDDRTSTPVQSK